MKVYDILPKLLFFQKLNLKTLKFRSVFRTRSLLNFADGPLLNPIFFSSHNFADSPFSSLTILLTAHFWTRSSSLLTILLTAHFWGIMSRFLLMLWCCVICSVFQTRSSHNFAEGPLLGYNVTIFTNAMVLCHSLCHFQQKIDGGKSGW